MKTLTTAITVLFVLCAHANAAKLSIELVDVAKATGTINIQLVDQAAFDGKGEAIARKQVKVSSTANVSLAFEGIKPGKYAVMVMHDENDNGKLDSNILGIPKEGYGFSNNPRVMRQPTFDESMIEIKDADLAITINVL
jgi:uncharacterized protein (DUF2141 family)